MSVEEEAIAKSLPPEMVQKIDAELMRHAKPSFRKVAMLVGLAMGSPMVQVPGLTDAYYVSRIKALVSSGKLESWGNLDYMRYSEVRLPSGQGAVVQGNDIVET